MRAEGEGLLQDRRGDVIRQIAGHGGCSPLRQVCLENVGLHQRKPGFIAKLGAQILHQYGINFDRDDAVRSRQQVRR